MSQAPARVFKLLLALAFSLPCRSAAASWTPRPLPGDTVSAVDRRRPRHRPAGRPPSTAPSSRHRWTAPRSRSSPPTRTGCPPARHRQRAQQRRGHVLGRAAQHPGRRGGGGGQRRHLPSEADGSTQTLGTLSALVPALAAGSNDVQIQPAHEHHRGGGGQPARAGQGRGARRGAGHRHHEREDAGRPGALSADPLHVKGDLPPAATPGCWPRWPARWNSCAPTPRPPPPTSTRRWRSTFPTAASTAPEERRGDPHRGNGPRCSPACSAPNGRARPTPSARATRPTRAPRPASPRAAGGGAERGRRHRQFGLDRRWSRSRPAPRSTSPPEPTGWWRWTRDPPTRRRRRWRASTRR